MSKELYVISCLALMIFVEHLCESVNYDSDPQWIEKVGKLNLMTDVLLSGTKEHNTNRMVGSDYFNVTFECSPGPTSVHQLRPQDIDVVGAMGDSFTAGNGIEAASVPEIETEDRGLSWTIGGDQDLKNAITIPNILKNFNPKLKGFSTGIKKSTQDLWFNVAVAGARSRNMPAQARELISRMKQDARTKYETDWKLISIFVGWNDLCTPKSEVDASPENYVKFLMESLDILHAELPRALVNVIDVLDASFLRKVGYGDGERASCGAAQSTLCGNVMSANNEDLALIREKNELYQTRTEELINSGRYDTREDFTVVLQPFLEKGSVQSSKDGEIDGSYFAPDCIHLNDRGHAMAALNLWNNMLEPVGRKSSVWSITNLKCPTPEAPYIFTRLNSATVAKVSAVQQAIGGKNEEIYSSSEVVDSQTVWRQNLKLLKRINTGKKAAERISRGTGIDDLNVKFSCSRKPTSVHQLRPGDVDVVGAMGDSLTAGTAAEAEIAAGVAFAYRGLSWSIGGEGNMTTSLTLPNILRNFNHALKGYSQGITPGDEDLQWFNAAVPGARASDMPVQAVDLIERMQNDTRTDYGNDWKVITIFIGVNDLCAMRRDIDATPEKYVERLRESLDILHEKVPRALVNLVEILEIYRLPGIADGEGAAPGCHYPQLFECNYVAAANESEREKIKENNEKYQELTRQLIDSGRYDTRDDFTVVLQPFLEHTTLPLTESGQVDASYFAPDCFHFSTKGHAMCALNLWNNMLEPVTQKSTAAKSSNLKCPTEEAPYLFTRLNSGREFPSSTSMMTTAGWTSEVVTSGEEVISSTEKQDGAEMTTTSGKDRLLSRSALFWTLAVLLSLVFVPKSS